MPPRSARVAVFHAPGQPFTLESLPLPTPGPGETLVRITCATICGSDLHTHAGRRIEPAPLILGHEMIGVIESTSQTAFAPGDRVTWSMVCSCGLCGMCRRGLHPKCERLFKFGHSCIHGSTPLTGGFAEYCLLPAATHIFPVPPNLSDAVASTANCATATVASTLRRAGELDNKSVLVLGLGMLGLTACAMARDRGARAVHAIDTNAKRLALAAHFGASSTPPDQVDLVLDFSGSPDAIESSLPLASTGATLILAGSVFPSRPLQIPAEQIVRQCLTVIGVHNYSPSDLATALGFLSQTTFPFASLIEGRFPLDQINEAFAYANSQKPPRVALYP